MDKQQPTLEELQEKFKDDPEGLLAAVLARKAHRKETQAERHKERAAERERQEALLTDLLDKQSAEVVRTLDAEHALLIVTLEPLRKEATALAKLVADWQCARIVAKVDKALLAAKSARGLRVNPWASVA